MWYTFTMKKRDLLGYGAASFADSGPYNFVMVFFILFLTTVAGISPEKAGTISSITILLDGIAGAILGYVSDNIRSRHGRRRPFLLASMLPLLIGLIAMFTNFNAAIAMKTVIYMAAGVLFWIGFSMYYTPYTALGAEVTRDYDERSILRTYCRYFALAGNFLGVVFPLIIVQRLQRLGMTESAGWIVMAALMGIISVICIFTTWRSANGKDIPPAAPPQKINIKNLIIEYIGIIALKPFKYIAGIIILFIMANTFYNSSLVFFARYSLGVDDNITSVIFLISMIANLAYTPLVGKLAVRYDKKYVLAISMILSGLFGLFFFVISIHSFFGLAFYACMFSISYCCFWQLINALVYDLSEVGEFATGRRVEGSITSVTGLAMVVGTSIGTQILGWVLKFELYGSAFLLLPGLFLIAAGIVQLIYPIDKRRFAQLKTAISEKTAGGDPDISNLKRII